nr:Ger(x)C family spore germination protein [Evansella caseinilytica]
MNKWILLLMSIIIILPGCWGSNEVDKIGIVVGLGIDYVGGDSPILLTAQVVDPGAMESQDDSGPFFVITSEGRTFFDAIQNFTRHYPRRLIFSHNKVIVMGGKYAEKDVTEVIDYIDRDREFRENIWVLTAAGAAKEVIQTELAIETLPTIGIHIIMKEIQRTAFANPIQYYDFSNRMKGEMEVSAVPLITIVDRESKVNEQLAKSGEPVERTAFTTNKEISLEQTSIFKNRKKIGTIDQNASRGLLWLRNKLNGGTVIITGNTEEAVSVQITEGKTTITPVVNGDQVSMTIDCEGVATIREVEDDSDLGDPKVISDLKKQLEEQLTARIRQVIEIAQQELKTDFVGFGQHLYNKQPEEWRRLNDRWEEIFPEIAYEINVDITIESVGLITNFD